MEVKKQNRQPSPRQRKLAEELTKTLKEAKPLNGGQLLEKVGYSKGLQKQPGRVLEGEGVKKALSDLGFTLEGADNVVREILYDKRIKPDTRLNASDKVYKRLGGYAPEKRLVLTADISPEIRNRIDGLLSQAQ